MCVIAAAIGVAAAFGGSAVAGAVAGAVGTGFFASAVGSAIVGAVAGGVIGAGLSLVTGQDPLMGALGGALGGGLAAYSGGFGFDTGQSLTAGADAATAGVESGLSGASSIGPDGAIAASNPIAPSASAQGAEVIGSATQGLKPAVSISNPLQGVTGAAVDISQGVAGNSQGFFGNMLDKFNGLSDPMQEGILKAGTEGLKGAFTPDATEAARAKAEAEASGLMARDAATATRDYGNVTEALKQFGTPQSAQITDTGNFSVTIDPKTGQYVYLGRRPNRGFGGAAQAGQPAFAIGVA